MIVEGEVKTIVMNQTGFDAVGIMGKSAWKEEWASLFEGCGEVVVALDPDADDEAAKIAEAVGGRVAILPQKPDDMIVKHKATREDIEWFLSQARKP